MTKATEQEPVATQMNLVLNWSKELRPCALSRKARGSTQGRGSDRLTASVGNHMSIAPLRCALVTAPISLCAKRRGASCITVGKSATTTDLLGLP